MKRRTRWLIALPALLLVAALGGIAWLLHTTSGASWLLARVPGLQVEAPEGMLMRGAFSARRLLLTWPGGSAELRGLRWQGLHLSPFGRELHLQALSVDSIAIRSKPGTTPTPAPESLALPLGVHIAALKVGSLSWAADQPALTGLEAQLDAPRQGRHELRLSAASWQHLTLSGQASVDTAAPLATQATLQVQQTEATDLPWTATLTASGPLAGLQVHADLQAARQTLTADARVTPFAPWPLAALTARADGLDLAALAPGAPRTSLTGSATLGTPAANGELALQLDLRNAATGRWDQGALPVQALRLALAGRPDQLASLRLTALDAQLPGGAAVQGEGRREADGRWQLNARVRGLRPELLDARAAAARLDGPLRLSGGGGQPLAVDADLGGTLQANPLRLRLLAQGEGTAWRIAEARLTSGEAQLSASGQVDTRGQATLTAQVRQLDPRLLWRGTPGSAWARLPGATRLNADARLELRGSSLATLTGSADARVLPSQLAGLALDGQVSLQRARATEPAAFDLNARLGSNRLQASGSAQPQAVSAQAKLQAPVLAELNPLLALFGQGPVTGKAEGDGALQARRDGSTWQLGGSGTLALNQASLAGSTLASASARWELPALGPDGDAPLVLNLDARTLRHPQGRIERLQLALQGRRSAHTLSLQLDGRAAQDLALNARAQASGAWVDGRWAGRVASLQVAPLRAGTPPLLAATDLALRWGPGQRLEAAPGRAEVAGAGIRWQVLSWQGGEQPEMQAELQLESLAVAPLLARWQPDFGWGGDLLVAGRASLRLAGQLTADVLIERQSGDLRVTDEFGSQALDLTDLRLALTVKDGVWQIAQGFAGAQLGGLGGALTLKPAGAWPDANTPIEGVLQANVAKLANWGAWVPPGWRLAGQLAASVQLGGRLGAPDLRGEVGGEGLALRHLLYGVDVTDGRFALALNGQQAQLTRLEARGGDGWLRATGSAELGASPALQLQINADRLRVLSRVDRRVVASGEARLALDAKTLTLDGLLRADEGLYDFSRSDAPALADDVEVLRGPRAPAAVASAPAGGAAPRQVAVKLGLDFGRAFQVRGRGLETRLRGQLQLTQQGSTASPPRLTGKLSATGGQYAAYGQKLEIERGDISFTGALDNPVLDMLAIRPNLDTRVGVRVTGTAQSPRVALYSEPDMGDTDKLSWLLLGRGPDGLGRTDTALLQRAAVALLAGEGEGVTGRAIKGLGLDELSLSQADDDTRATIVRLGKQLSRRWYVGYERSLNATTGSWQLIYRIAQRFTLRAQSGDDNALDLIWQWRWN